MALPDYSMSELLEAGAHFGHQKHRWNPKMEPFIFGVRNNIHILEPNQKMLLGGEVPKNIGKSHISLLNIEKPIGQPSPWATYPDPSKV